MIAVFAVTGPALLKPTGLCPVGFSGDPADLHALVAWLQIRGSKGLLIAYNYVYLEYRAIIYLSVYENV